jgi:hypothetical protein
MDRQIKITGKCNCGQKYPIRKVVLALALQIPRFLSGFVRVEVVSNNSAETHFQNRAAQKLLRTSLNWRLSVQSLWLQLANLLARDRSEDRAVPETCSATTFSYSLQREPYQRTPNTHQRECPRLAPEDTWC